MMEKVNEQDLKQVAGGTIKTAERITIVYAMPDLQSRKIAKIMAGQRYSETGNTQPGDGLLWFEVCIPDSDPGFGWITKQR